MSKKDFKKAYSNFRQQLKKRLGNSESYISFALSAENKIFYTSKFETVLPVSLKVYLYKLSKQQTP